MRKQEKERGEEREDKGEGGEVGWGEGRTLGVSGRVRKSRS